VKILILPTLLIFLSGAFDGAKDTMMFHFGRSVFVQWDNPKYYDAQRSGGLKYATENGKYLPAPNTMYYRTFKISHKERYPLSATLLSFTTDGWHLAKMLGALCQRVALVLLIFLTFVLPGKWENRKLIVAAAIFLAFWTAQVAGFHLTYTFLLQ